MSSPPQATLTEATSTLAEMESLTDANPEDLSQQQASTIAAALREDLFLWCWFIHGFRDLVPSIHGQMCEIAKLWGADEWRRVMVQIPREHFKTSVMTLANSLWQTVREPNEPIVIYNEKLDNAAMWVRTIRDTVANSRLFHALFPEHTPPGIRQNDTRSLPRYWKWSDTELLFPRDVVVPETSITAMGVGAASAGRHWPKMIKDDLISEDAVNSPSVMSTVIDWFDRSLYLERPALKGMDLVVCTPWAYEDLYAHILRNYDYKLYRRASLENTLGEPDVVSGESIFPTKLTTAELKQHYNRDPFGFQSQMQCQPRAGRDQSFDDSWDRYGDVINLENVDVRSYFRIEDESYDPNIVGDLDVPDTPPQVVPFSQMERVILWDPAPSEQREIARDKASRNGIVVLGHDCWGRKYVLEAVALRLDPYEMICEVFRLMEKWGTTTVGIEEVIFSKLYRHWMEREATSRGTHYQPLKLSPGKMDKDTRIKQMIPGMKQGLFYYNTEACAPLFKEKLEYPYSAAKDCLDAMSYHYRVARPEAPSEWEERVIRSQALPSQNGGRCPVTGY
jgi:hypothetical protein